MNYWKAFGDLGVNPLRKLDFSTTMPYLYSKFPLFTRSQQRSVSSEAIPERKLLVFSLLFQLFGERGYTAIKRIEVHSTAKH